MPKVISYTPPWLSRPSPGASLFSSTASKGLDKSSQSLRQNDDYTGPTRVLAQRGNEVFTVVDNQIRWSSLTRLKDEWQQEKRSANGSAGQNGPNTQDGSYRVLVVPVYERIRQLIPSPNGAFLAIVADHTVFIAVLPDSSHLSTTDQSPIRIKTYQLGPTTHVIPESPVMSALWHPLGIHTNLAGCFVTVTADAAVRVWELDRNNHWSFDRPTLAIDLRKLVDGTSSDQDFTPSGFGKSKGFSADFVDMEVASACFGGTGSGKEDAWAPMTLWVAMRPGDLYVLSPLLPSKWRAPATTIPSLSAAIIPKLAALQEDPVDMEDQLTACRQQYDWLAEIDNQEPLLVDLDADSGSEILTRPANPSAIPRLQGPFRVDTGDELDDLDLCDIVVVASKIDTDALMMGEEDELILEDNGEDKLSATVICLSAGSGRVHVCLELDGVEGQWLPKAKKNAFRTPVSEPSDLVLVESLDTLKGEHTSLNNWPTFTKDVFSPYSFFVTNFDNVTSISLSSWVQRLEAELQADDPAGSGFRLEVLCEGSVSIRERLIQMDEGAAVSQEQPLNLSSCLVYYDYDIGYLLLTSHASHPYAAIMDSPEITFPEMANLRIDSDSHELGSAMPPPRRPPYQVPSIFYADSPLEFFVDKHVPHRQRQSLREQVRLSPATLDLVAAAHRTLSSHTNALERAASDLFRRCERLQGELQDQLKQLSDVAERIRYVSSEVGEDGERKEGSRSGEALENRLQGAKDRQTQLVQRYEKLRNKVLKSGGRPLSEREKSWASEVDMLSGSFENPKQDSQENIQQLSQRLDAAKEIASELLSEAKSVAVKSPVPAEPGSPASPSSAQPRVPHRLQRARIADAMKMVERESAVIDAITSRLDRLTTSL
ncbi:nuclear pore complex protein An-Nup82 [Aspergillus campestris IBT 28561]|uniref:Nuclear pore complex protein An-Nup82 n=1 Tax=Aspergillus campestris (strain IBT 28561) TaxID=1392248 RepID=A0A2I1CYQ2_ASPC2|nr:nuclear pore complex protein An-Nup82 [Aspergillus campestris IBT 28561]PKY02762.1 nuclear pore complex protein An-Nup82 [Aspergillus campestris IBT 28561]